MVKLKTRGSSWAISTGWRLILGSHAARIGELSRHSHDAQEARVESEGRRASAVVRSPVPASPPERLRGAWRTAPLKALFRTCRGLALAADHGGGAGENRAERDEEDCDRAVKQAFKGKNFREGHDKLSFLG